MREMIYTHMKAMKNKKEKINLGVSVARNLKGKIRRNLKDKINDVDCMKIHRVA